MKRRIVFMSVVFMATALAVAGQIEVPDWENSVDFRLVTSQEPLRPGDRFEVALVAEIEEGYHLYGPEEAYPSRTEVVLDGENLEVGEVEYPPVEKRELSGLGTYDLYEGHIAIRLPVTLTHAGAAAEYTLKAVVNYQVCTDFACSAPTSDKIAVTVAGAPVGAEVQQQHGDIFERK